MVELKFNLKDIIKCRMVVGGVISRDFLVHISGDVRKFNEFRQHFNMVEHGLLLEEWMQIRGRGIDIFRKNKMNKYIYMLGTKINL